MPFVKYHPFSLWFSDRLLPVFEEGEIDNWPPVCVTEGLDIYETDTDVVVKAAVPGIPADKA
jgi:HSP20 family molecular chaperone IbpA